MIKHSSNINHARRIAFDSFVETLEELNKQTALTELQFRDAWFNKMNQDKKVLADGWYNPPPLGMVVLAGEPTANSRMAVDSLRPQHKWPSEKIIDTKNDALYCYASPVNKQSGEPGDFAATLYFGNDKLVKEHFAKTFEATQEVIELLPKVKSPKELFTKSQDIFKSYNLKNSMDSITDPTSLNLGHSFPKKLNKLAISKSRKFINSISEWDFVDKEQFTIEPRLFSADNNNLPQVSYHYIATKRGSDFVVCNDVNELLAKYELTK